MAKQAKHAIQTKPAHMIYEDNERFTQFRVLCLKSGIKGGVSQWFRELVSEALATGEVPRAETQYQEIHNAKSKDK